MRWPADADAAVNPNVARAVYQRQISDTVTRAPAARWTRRWLRGVSRRDWLPDWLPAPMHYSDQARRYDDDLRFAQVEVLYRIPPHITA